MSALEHAANRFKAWAADRGILSYDPPEEIVEYDGESLSDIAAVNEPQNAEHILRAKRINFIGVEDTEGVIVVCTHRKISNRDHDILPKETEEGIKIEYIKAHPPFVKFPTMAGTPGGNYSLHNSNYTCGSSISVGNCISAGTLGCLVRNADGDLFGLTNNHVSGGCGYSDPNLPIVAPGLFDVRPNGRDPFTIGHHHKVSPWVSGSPENVDVTGNIDAALFRIKESGAVSSMQQSHYDTPTVVANPATGLTVEKVGRTTNHTRGRVVGRSVGYTPVGMAVPNFQGTIFFSEVFVVQGFQGQPFSDKGDSGSLVCSLQSDGSREAFGVLFAGSGDKQLTFVIEIARVLSLFNVSLVGNHNV